MSKRERFVIGVICSILFFSIGLFFALNFTRTSYEEVDKVLDGDTFITKSGEHIRLRGVDSPEHIQPFGEEATAFTTAFVLGKKVTVIRNGKDKYGRSIADVYADEMWLNDELVKNGYAWHYSQFDNPSHKDSQLEHDYEFARSNHIGLWALPNPVSPYNFRHHKN